MFRIAEDGRVFQFQLSVQIILLRVKVCCGGLIFSLIDFGREYFGSGGKAF